eukprot:GEMP01038203.1.p1 GENE.GEMP01038203.1~~GEMP01038203.1.p1  ORF type:complete len:203 (+),score=44.61 GEMP01038203.1:693-1301(+)
MGETTLARQLHAFNYTDECDNVWHLLFSRLPQMALEDDWENTSPERQEVISFLNRHKKYDTILDALEKCDFCKTFLRYEFEDGEESQIPKLSLLPNLFFVLELLETHKIFMASSRPASILFTHLQSAVQRYRAFWEQNPFYILYIELLRVSLERLGASAESSGDTLDEKKEFALHILSRFVDFVPKVWPVSHMQQWACDART